MCKYSMAEEEPTPALPLGLLRVLVVEDDKMQQEALFDLFHVANKKNDGVVTFETTGLCTRVRNELQHTHAISWRTPSGRRPRRAIFDYARDCIARV